MSPTLRTTPFKHPQFYTVPSTLGGLHRGSPLTISSSQEVWSTTIDPRHPRVGLVAGKTAAWECPHHLQTAGAYWQGKGNIIALGPTSLSFLFFSFFSLHSLCCMTGPSLGVIKGKVQYLSGGQWDKPITIPRTRKTHSQPQPIETWELIPLSTVCNPYYKLSASNTSSSSQLDVGTLGLNQYTSSCPLCIAIWTQMCNPLNLVVGGF
jgi:hypothetical protein